MMAAVVALLASWISASLV